MRPSDLVTPAILANISLVSYHMPLVARCLVASIFQVQNLISPRHGVWVPSALTPCYSLLPQSAADTTHHFLSTYRHSSTSLSSHGSNHSLKLKMMATNSSAPPQVARHLNLKAQSCRLSIMELCNDTNADPTTRPSLPPFSNIPEHPRHRVHLMPKHSLGEPHYTCNPIWYHSHLRYQARTRSPPPPPLPIRQPVQTPSEIPKTTTRSTILICDTMLSVSSVRRAASPIHSQC